MTIWKKLFAHDLWRFILSATLATIFFILDLNMGSKSVITAVLLFVVTLLATEAFMYHYVEEHNERIDEIAHTLEQLSSKLIKMVEMSALYSEQGTFEKVLRKLRDRDLGKVTWLVAKFISEKLHRDFSPPDVITINDYGIVNK